MVKWSSLMTYLQISLTHAHDRHSKDPQSGTMRSGPQLSVNSDIPHCTRCTYQSAAHLCLEADKTESTQPMLACSSTHAGADLMNFIMKFNFGSTQSLSGSCAMHSCLPQASQTGLHNAVQ